MRFAADAAIGDAGDSQDNGFDFGRHELLSADVDYLAHAAENTKRAVRPLLDLIARLEPAVGGKTLVARVEVASDLRVAA